LNGRNFTQWSISPRRGKSDSQDEGTVGVYGNVAYSMNGVTHEYTTGSSSGTTWITEQCHPQRLSQPEAIAEFKVLTSNYGAQYGRNGLGTVEVETNPEALRLHGSAFEYLATSSSMPSLGIKVSTLPSQKLLTRNMILASTVGGPVYVPNHYNADQEKDLLLLSRKRAAKRTFHDYQNGPRI